MSTTDSTEPVEEDPRANPKGANSDVIPAPPGLWLRIRYALTHWTALKPSDRLLRWTAATTFVAVTVGGVGVAYATFDYSNQYSGLILPGTRIAGVELGGMTQSEAFVAVESAIRPQMERPITLRWKDMTWRVSPRRLGARNDLKEVVAAAAQASRDASFFHKARLRVLGTSDWFDRGVEISYPKRALRSFLEGLASGFDRPARDATVDYSSGWVELVEEHSGRRLLKKQTYRTLVEALDRGASTVALTAETERPKVHSAHFDQVLLLRIGENKLYLYEDGKITHHWTVATGQPAYPTPTGMHEITEKRYMPTWVNPDPTGWGVGMPASIPPGIGNPLGLRALNWSADGIRFHGTSAIYSLGYNASHGCVRMSNQEVIDLYEMVDVGTPIVSTIVAPLRPLYSSAPDPTVVDPEPDDTPRAKSDSEERKTERKKGN